MDDNIAEALGLFGPRDRRMAGLLGPPPGIQQTQGPSMPGMPTPRMPMTAPAPMGPDNRSLWQRVQDNVRGMPSRLMPSPVGLEGLLSDDDTSNARNRGMLDMGLSLMGNASGVNGGNAPSLGQALQAGVQQGRQSYNQGIESTLQNRMTGVQMGMQQHVLQARSAIGSYLSKNLGGTPAEQMSALRNAYQMAVAVGDMDMAKTLSPMLEKDTELGAKEPQAIPAGGRTVLLDPRTHKPIGEIPHTATPMSDDSKGFRQDAAAARQESIDMRLEQQRSQREARYVGQYTQNVQPFAQSAAAYQTLAELRSAAMKGDPIAQQTALQDYLRMVLPGQAIAQGEIHSYAGMMGLGDKAEQLIKKLENGQPLSTAQMKSIYDRADGLIKAKKSAHDNLRKQAQDRGAKYQIDADAYPDFFQYLNIGAPQGPPPTGAGAIDRHLNKSY